MAPAAANENKISPLVWLFFGISVLLDLSKIAVFFVQLIPVVGIELSIVLSFYISAVEIVVVFGGLWWVGLYRAGQSKFLNGAFTFGVTTANLIPEVDDFPFTSISVFIMIMTAYAQNSKLGGAALTAATSAASAKVGPRLPAHPPQAANEERTKSEAA